MTVTIESNDTAEKGPVEPNQEEALVTTEAVKAKKFVTCYLEKQSNLCLMQ